MEQARDQSSTPATREALLDLRTVEVMHLTGRDRDVLFAALAEPPEPTERLIAALRRHRELFP